MTLDQLLLDLGLVLARDESKAPASHMLPNLPQVPAGQIYAVALESGDSVLTQGHGWQRRKRLLLVMLYGAPPTVEGKRLLEGKLLALRTRACNDVDRHPGLRLEGLTLADAPPTLYDAETRTHYGGQRLALTYVQRTLDIP